MVDDGSASARLAGAEDAEAAAAEDGMAIAVVPSAYFYFAGVSVLLGWNLVLTFTRVFDCDMLRGASFAGSGWAFWAAFSFNAALNCVQLLMTCRGFAARISFALRWCGGSVGMAVGALGLMLSVALAPEKHRSVAFLPAVCSVALMGFSAAFFQATVFGIAGAFGPKLVQVVMVGQGIAGFVAGIVGFVCASDLRTGLFVTFPLAAFFSALGVPVYFFGMRRNPLIVKWLEEHKKSKDDPQPVVTATAGSNNAGDASMSTSGSDSLQCTLPRRSSGEILRKSAWPQALTVSFVFVVTFVIFPGVTSRLRPSRYVTFLVATFQLLDVLGRAAPRAVAMQIRKGHCLSLLAVLRAAFIPAFMVLQRSEDAWARKASLQFPMMAVFAFSNGYLCTNSMMLGPAQRGVMVDEKEATGTLMSFFLGFGIFLGSLLALLTQIGMQSQGSNPDVGC